MQLVREHIDFKRGLDPKHAMSIGLASKRSFDNDQEAAEWCFLFPEICSDGMISNWKDAIEKKWRIKRFDYDKTEWDISLKLTIVKWIKANLSYNNENPYSYGLGLKEAKHIFDLLEAIVDDKYINESLNFQRGIDPKQAMGIGLIEQWKEYMDTVANYDCTWVYERDFKDKYCDETFDEYSAYIVRIIYHTLSWIVYKKMPAQEAFDKVCKDEDIKKIQSYPGETDSEKVREKIAEILFKKLNVVVK